MGLLSKIGDVIKGGVGRIPVVGDISDVVFGPPGSGGLVGRIVDNKGGGITSGIPQFPGIPGPFGGINVPGGSGGNGNGSSSFSANGSTNGHFSGDVAELLGGDRLIMEPELKTIHSAPPGWVIATMPDGSKKAVRKEVARCLGLWKPRKKPPISASDWGKLKTANRVRNKAKKIAQTAEFKVLKK